MTRPTPPPGPSTWRNRGLLALLALFAVLLVARECGAPATAQEAGPAEEMGVVERWRPAAAWLAGLFRPLGFEPAQEADAAEQLFVGADPVRGRELAIAYGCGACHRSPDLLPGKGSVGPDLGGFAGRAYIAGVLPNRPGELVRWLMNAPAIAPLTAMPNMGVDEDEARDLAAWLYATGGA
jgi:cytochrome c2